jgi:transposase
MLAQYIREGVISVAQAARDLDVHGSLLRKCLKQFSEDPRQAFCGHGVVELETELASLNEGN